MPVSRMRGATRLSSSRSTWKSELIGRAQLAICPPNPAMEMDSDWSRSHVRFHSSSLRSQTFFPSMRRSSMAFQPTSCKVEIWPSRVRSASSANPVNRKGIMQWRYLSLSKRMAARASTKIGALWYLLGRKKGRAGPSKRSFGKVVGAGSPRDPAYSVLSKSIASRRKPAPTG